MAKRANTHGKHRQRLYLEYESTCWLCLKPHAAEIDHVIPVAQGGSDEYINLRLAHKDCNVARNRQSHPFHKAPEITVSGYPTRWHHIELHPDMWRDDFAAKAKILARKREAERLKREAERVKREAARLERERQQAEWRAKEAAALKPQIDALERELHMLQNELTNLDRLAPQPVSGSPVNLWLKISGPAEDFLEPLTLPFQVFFVILGLWLFNWGPFADPDDNFSLFLFVIDAVILYIASLILIGLLMLLNIGITWLFNQTRQVKDHEDRQRTYKSYERSRSDLCKRIDQINVEKASLTRRFTKY